MAEKELPLLCADPDDIASRVLVVGDPDRAADAARLLQQPRRVGANREYLTFTGEFAGRRVSIASHGVGAAGAGLCFEELARAGATTLIRAGTCGAIDDRLQDGALVIATGAVREEGLTPKLIPLSYPAIAHHELIAALQQAAERAAVEVSCGLVLTEDRFYPSAALGQDWRVWKASQLQVVEMETSALFIIAQLHGLRAGAIFTVDGNPTRAAEDMSEYDPHRRVVKDGKQQMLILALDALTRA